MVSGGLARVWVMNPITTGSRTTYILLRVFYSRNKVLVRAIADPVTCFCPFERVTWMWMHNRHCPHDDYLINNARRDALRPRSK